MQRTPAWSLPSRRSNKPCWHWPNSGRCCARDLAEHGLPTMALSRLVAAARLERVARGVYSLPGRTLSEHRSLAQVSLRVPQGVVCLLSALRVHEIGTQAPLEVWIAIPRNSPTPGSTTPLCAPSACRAPRCPKVSNPCRSMVSMVRSAVQSRRDQRVHMRHPEIKKIACVAAVRGSYRPHLCTGSMLDSRHQCTRSLRRSARSCALSAPCPIRTRMQDCSRSPDAKAAQEAHAPARRRSPAWTVRETCSPDRRH